MQNDIEKLDLYLKGVEPNLLQQLKKYYEALVYFNSKVNLVSKSSLPFAARQHFSDCYLGLSMISHDYSFDSTVYDFGSGNGFPGVVLSIIRPDIGVCLVEHDVRKAEFLKHVKGELKLDNVTVFAGSIDKLEKNSITHGITRALGSIAAVLLEVNSLFVKGGRLYHFKAENWSTEIANCPTQIFEAWDIQSLGQYTLPDTDIDRFIISSIRK